MLDDPKFLWVKRHEEGGKEKNQAVAVMKGKIDKSVFLTGIGYRGIEMKDPYCHKSLCLLTVLIPKPC